MTPELLSEATIVMLMDLIGQAQRQIIVLRRILTTKGVVTQEQLDKMSEDADRTIRPLRDQMLEALRKSQSLAAFEDLEDNENTPLQ